MRLSKSLPIKKQIEKYFGFGSIVESNRIDADYAFTSAMDIFRKNKTQFTSPESCADDILNKLKPDSRFEIKRSQFYLNISISNSFLSERITYFAITSDKNNQIPSPLDNNEKKPRRRVIIDYSSPNIAKVMHVGHLRSTVIGNCLALIHEYLGDEVIRVNHLGDWGTQFGALLAVIDEKWGEEGLKQLIENVSVNELGQLYQLSKSKLDSDLEFEKKAKRFLVELQSGSSNEVTNRWKQLVAISLDSFKQIYNRLGVIISEDWFVGESFYQDKVDQAISDLDKHVTKTVADRSILLYTNIEQAKIKNKDGNMEEIPLILKKSDGSIGYDATDVAAIRYRLLELKGETLIYVTDSGQSLHFQLVFAAAKLAGWVKPEIHSLEHVTFGIVRKGDGGGRIKSRSGGAPTLSDLLDSATKRMKEIFVNRLQKTEVDEKDLNEMAEQFGVSSVVFSELKTHRTNDYEFNVDRMCKPDGDTITFVLHVLDKIRRIKHKAKLENVSLEYYADNASSKERKVALLTSKFYDVLEVAVTTSSPHVLCLYVCSLASEISSLLENEQEPVFFEASDELDPNRGASRFVLLLASEKVIQQTLRVIGINSNFSPQVLSILDTLCYPTASELRCKQKTKP